LGLLTILESLLKDLKINSDLNSNMEHTVNLNFSIDFDSISEEEKENILKQIRTTLNCKPDSLTVNIIKKGSIIFNIDINSSNLLKIISLKKLGIIKNLSAIEIYEKELNLKDIEFSFYLPNVNLSKAKLSSKELIGSYFKGTNFKLADLSNSDLSLCDLTSADMMGAKLIGAKLNEADLIKAKLGEANLSGANLTNAKLKNSILNQTNFTRATLVKLELNEAKILGEINFSKCDLSYVDFRKGHYSKRLRFYQF